MHTGVHWRGDVGTEGNNDARVLHAISDEGEADIKRLLSEDRKQGSDLPTIPF